MKDQKGERFARYLSAYCGRFGVPQKILSDNSKTFDNRDVKLLEQALGFQHIYAAPRYSRGNSPAERAIQHVQEKITTLMQSNTDIVLDWEAALGMVALSINTKICTSTKCTPYELMFQREHKLVQSELQQESDHLESEIMRQAMERNRAEAVANSDDAHLRAKDRYDRNRATLELSPGELVLVERSDRRAKLSNRTEGPFESRARERHIS